MKTLPLVLLLGATLAFAQSNFSGSWKLELPRNDGSIETRYLDLQQSGAAVTGKVTYNYSSHDIKSGKVEGNKIHFELNPWRDVVQNYDGTLDNGTIHFTFTVEKSTNSHFTEMKGDAVHNTNKDAEKLPAYIEPPALHDVADNGLVRTPPMGWNSWNHYASRVTDQIVRDTADAIATNGMKDAGYIYVNIDDTWELGRDASGNITTNKKFPDMKALADYVHSKGLKLGIYSSPGPTTCAGYEGSYGHEEQDAKTYASWGIDYLKYDWCSAGRIYKKEQLQAVYQKMGDALLHSGRPIVYSLCEYGDGDVWKWGAKVGGNLWRTTGDIADSWSSMESIGFKQIDIAQYAAPGHFNDPDMLEIGNDGMTPDEYRTHMTLWSLLSAPLLAGNDVAHMSAETKSILLNRDIIAIDQDPAVKHPQRTDLGDKTEVWTREMADGSKVVAIFNRNDAEKSVTVALSRAGIEGKASARDLWASKDVTISGDSYTASVPRHGVVVLRVQ